ncbi:MAG: ABC transporter permease [Chloroflexi bacterium]|nr:ABC transporter permease [Chloroflexota bacterium]
MAQDALQQQPQFQGDIVESGLLRQLKWNIQDTLVIAWRNLMHIRRQPRLLVLSTVQPIMFLLLFTFVFGGAIEFRFPGDNYINFLLPGILIQAVIFGTTQTTVNIAEDIQKGVIDRFRSLPMGRTAVLAGRTLSDAARGLFVVTLMLIVGFLIGFRPEGTILNIVGAIFLAVSFGFVFSWISAFIGLLVGDVETAQVAGFIWVFPLVFASSIFVDPSTMPDWLRGFAENQPLSAIANAVRGLFFGDVSLQTVLLALAWIAGIFLVFMPLAVWQYGRSTD